MISKIVNRPLLVLGLISLLILASIPFQRKIDSQRNKFRSIEETLYVSSSALKKVSLGFDEILADIYWFRALQYVGTDDIDFKDKSSELLFKYFNIITDLDPKFVNAYRYGGTFLAEPYPHGLGDLEKGVQLFDKGRENNPHNFRLPLEEAFLYYLHTDEYDRAADLFKEASQKTDSDLRRATLKGMAATARLKAGDRELSRQIWEYVYENTQLEGRKNFALQNLNELNTMDFEDKLTGLVRKFDSDFGRLPTDLYELVEKGYLKKVPSDHKGENFVIAPEIKAVKSVAILKRFFSENIGFLNSRSTRFKSKFGRYPSSMNELKSYIRKTSTLREYPEHPLGEEYIYDPQTGEVDYDRSFLNKN